MNARTTRRLSTGALLLWAAVGLAACAGRNTPQTPVVFAPVGPAPGDTAGPIITFPNGLQLQEIVVGTGERASSRRAVAIHYTGTLQNGQKFDSSRDRNEPLVFVIDEGKVIAGMDQGIKGMRVGGKRRLIIPPAIAYGPEGRPPNIPPNATLTFEIELLEVR
jgi:FKBP-type peptidyl-prolyl cis-trans isomerase